MRSFLEQLFDPGWFRMAKYIHNTCPEHTQKDLSAFYS